MTMNLIFFGTAEEASLALPARLCRLIRLIPVSPQRGNWWQEYWHVVEGDPKGVFYVPRWFVEHDFGPQPDRTVLVHSKGRSFVANCQGADRAMEKDFWQTAYLEAMELGGPTMLIPMNFALERGERWPGAVTGLVEAINLRLASDA